MYLFFFFFTETLTYSSLSSELSATALSPLQGNPLAMGCKPRYRDCAQKRKNKLARTQ
jgi:hypothetical protein